MKLPSRGSSTPDPGKQQWWTSRAIRLTLVVVISIALGGLSLLFDPVSALTVSIGMAAAIDQIVRQFPGPN